ncbi:class I SAM-dependent methyltransferase [Synechococcus elongatus IITB4]|uniref:class I SAM-dependent methyltransferase n=1 Tax=Synechococcus elongatus TaxID=32046 RepID=UPI0030CC3B84
MAIADPWQDRWQTVARRYSREYRREDQPLPDDLESLAIVQTWRAGHLQNQIASPFWELVQPSKGQTWLDLGCGLSFLVYPWRDWQASFSGQDICPEACEILRQRGPQLNSKLFKGCRLAPAHQLDYPDRSFDGAIATGVSAYYPLDYWAEVLTAVQKVLKPGGHFLFDVVNPEAAIAEDWAILETYLGAPVELIDLDQWRQLCRDRGARIRAELPGPLFHLLRIDWPKA